MAMIQKTLSPFQLGSVQAKNKILMSGMHLGLENDDDHFQSLADFFEIRAKADVGMIVVGGCSPDKRGRAIYSTGLCISDDHLIDEHRKITSAISRHGSLAILQLCPFGRESFHGHMFAPSPIKTHSNIYRPKPLDDNDILESIENFALAVQRAKDAGYHAVEIVGSQGFLIHQFLAKRTNTRDDRWGGSLENRARYAVEVLRKIKAVVGEGYPIIFRLPSLDLVDGGIDQEEFIQITKMIVKERPALINVGIGWHDSPVPSIAMNVPEASFAPVARYVKSLAGDIPVAVSNRINDLRVAERLLQDGVADVIAMGRPLLADPDIIRKSQQQEWERINTCIACNQACLDNALKNKRVGCIVNPQCSEPNVVINKDNVIAKNIIVIGGGLAGMSAALWLQRFGHSVTLYEKSPFLGGQLRQAIEIPGKSIFKETLRYFEKELYMEGVDVRRGTAFSIDKINHTQCDHIVLALGAKPRELSISVADGANFISYEKILNDKLPILEPAVIIGSGAIALDMVGYIKAEKSWQENALSYIESNTRPEESAHFRAIASDIAPITLLSRSRKMPGSTIGSTTRWINLKKIDGQVNFVRGVDVVNVDKGSITIKNSRTGDEETLAAGTVISAAGQVPNNDLQSDIKSLDVPFTILGLEKSASTRYSAGEAIKQGYQFAKTMSE